MRIIKRGLDVALAGVGLALTIPLWPLIMAAIYRESPGPVFFRQRRAGRLLDAGPHVPGGAKFEEFEMLKFRSMRLGSEKVGAVVAAVGDSRITRVGAFLRKSRLDELPQLWNVLKGDMSVIGPRPEQPELARNLVAAIPYFEERMRGVKPGITGFAQVSLGYTGRALPGSEIERYQAAMINPYKVDEADGALADDMRMKMLYDVAYSASLENLPAFLRMETYVLFRTPMVMLRGLGR